MPTTKTQFRNSLQYLILERRVQITLPRKHVNEEAAGKYGHIVDVVECDSEAKFCPVVETDDGKQYTCYPSALEITSRSELQTDLNRVEHRVEQLEAKIKEALSISAVEDGNVSYEKALKRTRSVLLEA